MIKRMNSTQIRRAFLDYFKQHGHTEVPSSSLVTGDPTLIFTSAGMVQFKDTFLGLEKRAYLRATTAQKCMRVQGKHNDLENVGPSPRHHTFFEMLGNFSFGDYFKRDAIRYAWEFCTQVMGIDPQRLYQTVFTTDDEAYGYWLELGVDPSHILRMGEQTNFWSMGDVGPCGPTSELHYDFGPEACTCHEPNCSVLLDNGCERWLEIWNLVFMQFDQAADGSRKPLPKPGVDTGMGLERITAVSQSVKSNYETDLFAPIMDAVQEDLRHDNATRAQNEIAYRVIADHGRALTFLLADGVLPGNEGAAYVLRMVMRRAMRFGKKMGVGRPFLTDVARDVIYQMGGHYSELVARQDFIVKAIAQEEERFQQTLDHGLAILDEVIADLQTRNEKTIRGHEIFRLWDTYGFPIDLTRDVAQERGFTLDEAGFQAAMDAQRERARSAGKFTVGEREEIYRGLNLPRTEFIGYENVEAFATVLAIVRAGQLVEQVSVGDVVEVVLDQTPFYSESGGQVGDTGIFIQGGSVSPESLDEPLDPEVLKYIYSDEPLRVEIEDTQSPVHGVITHRGRVVEGTLHVNLVVNTYVDEARRRDIMRNHTATHLLHKALHEILGSHATQKGSLVAPDRLRFDFNHLSAISRDELNQIESRVNDMILRNLPVHGYVTSKEEALRAGAMALFGEKYGDQVRVVCISEHPTSYAPLPVSSVQPPECYSRELCGGTHLDATSEIGFFHIVSEGSVGAGLRRIEAVTGRAAEAYVRERLAWLNALAARLDTTPEQTSAKLQLLLDERDALKKELANLQRSSARSDLASILSGAQRVDGISVIATQVNAANADVLREMSDWLRDQLGTGVVVLGAVVKDKPSLIVSITPDLIARGLHAGDIIKPVAQAIGGSGGGRPNMAQAGGKDAGKLNEALALVPSVVEKALKGK